jgi:hypothetical protein
LQQHRAGLSSHERVESGWGVAESWRELGNGNAWHYTLAVWHGCCVATLHTAA